MWTFEIFLVHGDSIWRLHLKSRSTRSIKEYLPGEVNLAAVMINLLIGLMFYHSPFSHIYLLISKAFNKVDMQDIFLRYANLSKLIKPCWHAEDE